MRLKDITGGRFSRLVVLRKGPVSKSGGSLWVCACDCGTVKTINASNLRNGSVQSCGCAALEWSRSMGANPDFISKRAQTMTRHGQRRGGRPPGQEYRIWLGMKRRCQRPKSKDFKNYGARGISVCPRWNTSFEAFLEDMGPRPTKTHSIDRLDPNGNYEPGNCRWATAQEQGGENRRDVFKVTIDGVTYPSIKAACRAHGVNYTAAHMRIAAGHTVERAVTMPIGSLPNVRAMESYLPRNKRSA